MKRFLSMMLICFVAMSGFAENDVKGAFKKLGNTVKGALKDTGDAIKDFYHEMKPLFDKTVKDFNKEVMPLVKKKSKDLEKSLKKAKKEDLPKIQKQLQIMIKRLNEVLADNPDEKTRREIDKSLKKLDKLNNQVSNEIKEI
ncbi:MAG: hypothetical protein IKA37_07745 [Spirochaetales bacterium]|nr:hypothetical protein [Spirochaetales bacterium]MBR2317855.1 hypothetical protein [Spirochaetales bacterium]